MSAKLYDISLYSGGCCYNVTKVDQLGFGGWWPNFLCASATLSIFIILTLGMAEEHVMKREQVAR